MPDSVTINVSTPVVNINSAPLEPHTVVVDPAVALTNRVSDLEEDTTSLSSSVSDLSSTVSDLSSSVSSSISSLETYKSAKVTNSNFCIETDGGCIPMSVDPNYDNGPVLTSIFNAVNSTRYGAIVVPAKDYGIKTPVIIPAKVGSCFLGMGSGLRNSDTPSVRGACSRLVATADLDCIVENRSQGGYWRGVTLWAGSYTVNRCLWIRDNAGFGIATGHGQYISFTVQGGLVGVDISTAPSGSNASDLDFSLFRAVQCSTGMRTNSGQVLGLTVRNYTPYLTPTAFDFAAGGRFSVDGLEVVTSGTTIKIGGPGTGNCTYDFRNVGIDGAIPDNETVTLLEQLYSSSGSPTNILFTSVHRSGSFGGPFNIKTRGACHIKFDMCYGLSTDFFHSHTGTATGNHVVLTDCGCTVAAMADLFASGNSLKAAWQRCYKTYDATYGYHGVNFPDKTFTDPF